MIWTDAQVLILEREWAKGADAPAIAVMVGLSRSAVRSKRMRLGLPARSGVIVAMSNSERGRAVSRRSKAPPKGSANLVKLGPLRGSTPRPWSMREFGECAFPVLGYGAGTLSCCLPVLQVGAAYCTGHLAILRGDPWPPEEVEGLSQWSDA
jgi:hypothetical protein